MTRPARWWAAALVATVVLTGCAGSPDEPASSATPSPSIINEEQSQLLAITRFRNFDAGTRAFTAEIIDRATPLRFTGYVDYVAARGIADLTGAFDPQIVAFTPTAISVHPGAAEAVAAGDGMWETRDLDVTLSGVDALLATILALGIDRPENPLLLRQSGSTWIRDDEVEGVAVQVFAVAPDSVASPAPATDTAQNSTLRLWLDETGLLLRAEVRAGTGWVTIDFAPAEGATVPAIIAEGAP